MAYDDVKRFVGKVKAGRYWCISKSGFTKQALSYMIKNNVLFSTKKEIYLLAELLRIRFE